MKKEIRQTLTLLQTFDYFFDLRENNVFNITRALQINGSFVTNRPK